MNNLSMTSSPRNRERGSVAILIAFMWTALFGMAVVAVDFGYLYTKRRNVQAVADSAVTAAMPVLAGGSQSGATARAQGVANANNFTGADIVTNTATASQLTVTLQRTYPTFFGSVLGMTPKTIQATAIGRLSAIAGAAIHTNDSSGACNPNWTWAAGVTITGGGKLVINGDVEARTNKIELMSSDVTCTPATCKVTGTARSPCAIYNNSPGLLSVPITASATSVDPLAANTLATLNAFCTGGTSVFTPYAGPPMALSGTCDLIPPGVYCTNGNFAINPMSSTSFCPTNVTFIAAGVIQVGGNGAITFSAAAGVPNGIIFYSDFVGAGSAIQLANGPVGEFILNGSVYAPRGLINIGTGTPGFTMTGMLVGDAINIAMGPGQPWTFNGPTAGPSSWRLYK
jgi:Flp pilus assembly protein TadG